MNKIFKVKTKNGLAVVTSELAKNHSVVKTVKALTVATLAGLGISSQALAVSVNQLEDNVNWQIGLSADGQTVATNGAGRQILNDVQPTEKVLFSSKDNSLGINLTDTDSGPSSRDGVTVLDFKISKAIRDQINNAEVESKKHSTVVAGSNVNVQEGANAAGGKEYTVGLNKDVDLGADGSLTVNTTKINSNGKITGVTDGEVSATSKEAVNGSQLHAVEQKIKAPTTASTTSKNVELIETANADGGKNYEINLKKDVDLGADGSLTVNKTKISPDGQITGVKDGKVAANSKDAVNGGQLHAVEQKIKAPNTVSTTSKNVELLETANADGGKNYEVNLKKDVDLGADGSLTVNKTKINPNGKISGVTDGEVSATSKEAVNGSQLHAIEQKIKPQTTVSTSDLNFNIVEGVNADGGKNYDFALNNKVTIGKDSPVELDGTKGTVKAGDIVINDGGKITGVNPAELTETSKDAVNGSQLHATNQKVQAVQDQVNMGWNLGVEAVDGGEAVGTVSNVQMGDTVTVQAGKNIVVTQKGSKVKVATSERPEFKSVKVGKVSVDENKGIDAGNTNINNVAPAEISATSKQAVNGSQLHATNQRVGNLEKKVNQLGNRIDGGLAQANAMSGLIQATNPGKSLVSASVGAYRGKQAVAVGWSGMSDNGKIIYKLGVGANTADKVNFGGNASIGYQF